MLNLHSLGLVLDWYSSNNCGNFFRETNIDVFLFNLLYIQLILLAGTTGSDILTLLSVASDIYSKMNYDDLDCQQKVICEFMEEDMFGKEWPFLINPLISRDEYYRKNKFHNISLIKRKYNFGAAGNQEWKWIQFDFLLCSFL